MHTWKEKGAQLELCSLLKGCDDCPLETLVSILNPKGSSFQQWQIVRDAL